MIYTSFNIKGNEYYLESLNSGTISLKINNVAQNNILKKLIYIIEELNLDISTTYKSGTVKNTRQLGKELILKLSYKEILEIVRSCKI